MAKKSFVHPAALLWIYNLRSSVVHGSSIEIVTKNEYHTMLHAARRTLKSYVDFVGDNGINSHRELIKRLETSEEAKQLSEWLGANFDGEDARQIKEFLDEAIASYRRQ